MSESLSPTKAKRLSRTEHLELLLQKANSISGIRKMNMQFKEERRALKPFEQNDDRRQNTRISRDYWDLCQQFLQLMDVKRANNLK